MNEHGLNEQELATVLAALRLFQRTDSVFTSPENDIASNGGEIEPLSNAEIDALCERLNVSPAIHGDLQAARELAEAYLTVAEVRNAAGHHPRTYEPNITYDEAAERAGINPSLRAPVTCLLTAGYADAWEWAHEIHNGVFPQVQSLRGSFLDEAEFAAALQALRADPSIDDTKAAQIARSFTWNEDARLSSREEAFGAIAATASRWREGGPATSPAENNVASYLGRLQAAETSEAAFDAAFQALRSDGFMNAAEVCAVAAAYTGNEDAQYASRDAALGAIETHFYQAQTEAVEQVAEQGHGR